MTRNKLYLLLSCACILGYLWLFFSSRFPGKEVPVCLFKWMYGIPCPSCGSTRGMLALYRGEWEEAFRWNPASYLLAVSMGVVPVWILLDCVRKKDSLYQCFKKAEGLASRRPFWLVFVVLVLLNWIWTIQKGL